MILFRVSLLGLFSTCSNFLVAQVPNDAFVQRKSKLHFMQSLREKTANGEVFLANELLHSCPSLFGWDIG